MKVQLSRTGVVWWLCTVNLVSSRKFGMTDVLQWSGNGKQDFAVIVRMSVSTGLNAMDVKVIDLISGLLGLWWGTA